MGGQGVGAPARIIPARAGFTLTSHARATGSQDHPRTRGVYAYTAAAPLVVGGSSPNARGLRAYLRRMQNQRRIIPARAGFTRRWCGAPRGWRDHPRTRGVYRTTSTRPSHKAGSSPHARGLRRNQLPMVKEVGIIPARAGFTPRSPQRVTASWDHPRTRGVYQTKPEQSVTPEGSSPHARGLRRCRTVRDVRQGIIPARAGFTIPQRCSSLCSWDHPRTRGVYIADPKAADRARGSSPHARGLQRPPPSGPAKPRIIPARAGFTAAAPRGLWRTRDHPRTRGVYDVVRSGRSLSRGSSPHARGLRRCRTVRDVRQGIIPARAGFTPAARPRPPGRSDHPRTRGVYRYFL